MRAVTVALEVVETVARQGPIGVSELARHLDLPKSTVQRSLRAAADAGWLISSDVEPTRWSVAPRLLALVVRGVAPDLRGVAGPHVRQLRDTTGDAVHLVTRDGSDVVLLERLTGTYPVQVVVPLGFRVPLHAGATGKAILAASAPSDVERFLPPTLAALTESTTVDRAALEVELARIRIRGYATNDGEWEPTVAAVAAAIVTADGVVHGAVSVSSTPQRLDARRRRALGPVVAATAAAIAAALG